MSPPYLADFLSSFVFPGLIAMFFYFLIGKWQDPRYDMLPPSASRTRDEAED